MNFVERDFIPVLLGGDINTYSVARAFYEEYRVQTYVFGKYDNGPSYGSKITIYTANPAMDHDDVFLETINGFAKAHADKKIVVMGCGDNYVALVSKHKAELEPNIIAPYIDFEMMNMFQQKKLFYKFCDEYGLDYPSTIIYEKEMGLDFEMNFPYPVILKPSNGIQYFDHPFPTMKKVFRIHSREELEQAIKDTYASGYTDSMIIQDTIPGNDEFMRVLTSYSGKDGKVKMMCLGHVLLEEHTPKGMGNHAVIITEPNDELMEKAKKLLEDLHYTGYSNFDIKFDSRDGKFKFFELNTRQGRSNFYVTGSGFNVAKYIVEDYVYNKEIPFKTAQEEHLWTVVPKKVIYKHVKDEALKNKVRELVAAGKVVNPVFMKGDFKLNRWLRMVKQHLSHYKKFDTYYK